MPESVLKGKQSCQIVRQEFYPGEMNDQEGKGGGGVHFSFLSGPFIPFNVATLHSCLGLEENDQGSQRRCFHWDLDERNGRCGLRWRLQSESSRL